MIKNVKYFILLIMLIIPFNVWGIAVANQGALNENSPYFSVSGEGVGYCISPGYSPPKNVSGPYSLGDYGTQMLATYRMSFLVPESEWLPSELTSALRSNGMSAYLGHNEILAQTLGTANPKQLSSAASGWPAFSNKLICGGLYAVGREKSLNRYETCVKGECASFLSAKNSCQNQVNSARNGCNSCNTLNEAYNQCMNTPTPYEMCMNNGVDARQICINNCNIINQYKQVKDNCNLQCAGQPTLSQQCSGMSKSRQDCSSFSRQATECLNNCNKTLSDIEKKFENDYNNCVQTACERWEVKFWDCGVQLEGIDKASLDLLKIAPKELYPEFVEDKTKSMPEAWIFAIKMGGKTYENINRVTANGFGNALIEVYDCEIANKKDQDAGFNCILPSKNDMLRNNTFYVYITNNKSTSFKQNLEIKLKYNYNFPFNGTDAKVYYGGAGYQDLIVFGDASPVQKDANLTLSIPILECKVTTSNGKKTYIYNNQEISAKEYMNKCGCANITLDDLAGDESATNLYKEKCTRCYIKVESNGAKTYKYEGKNISVTDYLNKCGCEGITRDEVAGNANALKIMDKVCPVPKCEVKINNNKKEYYTNGKSVAIKKYIQDGCCKDLDISEIDDVIDKEIYKENCAKCYIKENKDGTREYKSEGKTISLAEYINKCGCDNIYAEDAEDANTKTIYNNKCPNKLYKCEVDRTSNKSVFKYKGNTVNLSDFINKKCCEKIVLEDVKDDATALKTYINGCLEPEEVIPVKCEVKKINGSKKYYYNGNEVPIKKYIEVGCCNDLTEEDIKDNEEVQELYRNSCTDNDTIYVENECGSKAKIGNVNYVLNNGVNKNLLTCTNESYVDYTHSYVWQLPMEKVMERVERTEKGTDNIEGIYNSSGLANYSDKTYMHSNITGKNGNKISGISSDNNYCMLLTSENNDIYFPGTAIATSGRFFVFNELNNEECTKSMNPGANCFRQPYILGKIDVTMHTNYEKWDTDYESAYEKEKDSYNKWQNDKKTTSEQMYKINKLKRETLEKYKTECEAHNNLAEYWKYNLNPELKFNYTQKVYGGKNRSEVIKETVDMVVSNSSVKYWPQVSTDINCKYENSKGSNKTYLISYGNVKEEKTFTSIENYNAKCEQTLYYHPKKITYATLPTGLYILQDEKYQSNPVSMLNNGLEIGYVYNVQLTTYEGTYTTSFSFDKLGYRDLNGNSKLQIALNRYKQENNLKEISSECVYCNQEGEFKRICEVCDDPNQPELGASFIYRTIALDNVTPNERENTNWSDEKGIKAKESIEALSGDKIITFNSNNNEKANLLIKNENNNNMTLLAGNIYNDQSKEYLEYEFTLTSKDMKIIKENSTRYDFSYGDISFCSNNYINNNVIKDANYDYCYSCNSDGKECKSSFIDAFGVSSITENSRKTKWKYFINGKWEYGNWNTIAKKYQYLEGFENGRYPDPYNQEAFIEKYKNWP